MPFPVSISGQIDVKAVSQRIDFRARLREALVAETVENVLENREGVSFRAIMRVRIGVARPGGAQWLFAIFDRGQFIVVQEQRASIRYQLSTRYAFWQSIGIASLLLIFLLLFAGQAGKVTGPAFAAFWCVAFVSEYQRAREGIRDWLHLIATAPVMPPPRPLKYDDP
jgi:hypothetical protein